MSTHLGDTGYSVFIPLGGPFGVLLFFTLSGFLMGHLYLLDTPNGPAIQKFLIARGARVLPLYLLVVTASYVASRLIGPDFVYYLTGTQFIRQIVMVGGQHVFWTIPPEVEFYLLFALGWWMLYNRWLAKMAPLLIGVAALALFFKSFLPGWTVFSQLHIFTIGVMAAAIRSQMPMDKWTVRSALAVQVGGLVLIALMLVGVVAIKPGLLAPQPFPAESFYINFPLCLMFGAAILAFSIPTGFANAIFANPVAKQLGACSFSLYLLHEPVMAGIRPLLAALALPQAVSIFMTIMAAIGVALLSHRFVERPLQRLTRDRLTAWVSRAWPIPSTPSAAKAQA